MTDNTAPERGDRAHNFDPTCNCGPCLEDRGLLGNPELYRLEQRIDRLERVVLERAYACVKAHIEGRDTHE